MEQLRKLTEDEFWDLYVPIEGADQNSVWEYEATKNFPITQVWTLVESPEDSEITYAIPGYRIVNKIGYAVTKKPWTTTLIEAVWYKP